jgi:hypothetical protein
VQHFVFFVVKKYRDHKVHKEKYTTKNTKLFNKKSRPKWPGIFLC